MSKQLDETEEIFIEYFEVLDKANEVKNNPELPQRALTIEYHKLTESFEKLLKTSVRISKLGDKAQKKLMKYKKLIDAFKNVD